MPNTPEEDALIDSFEEEHEEEHTPKAEPSIEDPSISSAKEAAPEAADEQEDAVEIPPQEQEAIEEAQGTETAEDLAVSPQPTDSLTPLQELPFEVSIEVSRLEMNFKTLSELKPGNLLELATRPENGVHLVVNGKKLARGELIRVGQLLGIRILEIKK